MAPLEIASVHGILQFCVNNDFAHEIRPPIGGEDNRHHTSLTVAGTGVIPPVRTDRRVSTSGCLHAQATGTIVNSDPLPAAGERLRESPEPHSTVVDFRLNSETPAELAVRPIGECACRSRAGFDPAATAHARP